MTNIGVIGDVHWGASYSMGRTDFDTQLNTRLLDFSDTFNNIIDDFEKNEVGLVVLTGDVFDSRHPSPAQLNAFAKCITRAINKDMEVVVVIGNHDQQRDISSSTLDPFGTLNLPKLKVYKDFGVYRYKDANLILMPYRDRRMMEAETNSEAIGKIRDKLSSITKNLNGAKIAVGHFMMEKAPNDANPDTFSLNELILPLDLFKDLDAVVMGHIHKHEVISETKPVVIYSGSMERVSFAEKDHNKVSLVFDPNNIEDFKIIPTDTRRLNEIKLDYTDLKNPLKTKLMDNIKKDIAEFDEDGILANSIVKVLVSIKEADLNHIDQNIIKKEMYGRGVDFCSKVQVIAITSRQLRDSSINETATEAKAFEKYISNMSEETDAMKNKVLRQAKRLMAKVDGK